MPDIRIESDFYFENKNKIKYFNFKKNKNTDNIIGSYFVVPIIYELDFNDELFVKNIKRFQQNKDPDYFDYTSNYVDLSSLYYHHQTGTYLMSFNWNISKKLDINFKDIYEDFENNVKMTQYYSDYSDEYGEYSIIKSFINDNEVIPIIIDDYNHYEMIKSEIEFNKIDKFYNFNGEDYLIWEQNDITKEVTIWTDIDDTLQEYEQIQDKSERSEDEEEFKNTLDGLKILYNNLNDYFLIGDYVLKIKPKQINKLLSHKSDLYIYFENLQNLEYDDFSINPDIINKDGAITNTIKILYMELEKKYWDEYKNSFKMFQRKTSLLEKMKKLKQMQISQNYPTYLMRGSQPNKFYEEFFQSPFIDNISLVSLKEGNIILSSYCDYGIEFNKLLTSTLKRLKMFIPNTVSFVIQDTYEEMRLDLLIDSHKYEEYFDKNENENEKSNRFGIIKDKLIGEFSTNDLINLYIQPDNKKKEILEKNSIGQDTQSQLITEFNILYRRLLEQNIVSDTTIMDKKYDDVKSYLNKIGFNTDDIHQKEIFGFLKSFCKSDFFKSNKIVGLICYSNPQIDMFYYPGQINLPKTDQLFQINLFSSYNKIQINYSSIYYVSDKDIEEYREQYSNELYNLSDYEVENLIYKENFEYFIEGDKFYIPVLFKIDILNKRKSYDNVNLKFSISDIQAYDYGRIINKPLFQDFDDYDKQFNYEENYEIPQLIHFIKNVEIEIPQVYSKKIIGHEDYEIPMNIKQN